MFEEAQLYAPVTQSAEGDVEVHLADDHPGATDEVYRARRNTIAALALAWRAGEPVPHAEYTGEEQEVWRVACAHLHELHQTLACKEYLEGKALLGLPEDHVPQLDEVTELLAPLTAFRYIPAAGLVPLRDFYGSLADRIFYSTQYIRHYSVPLYTPEPDVVHEVVGHANCLALPRFASLYQVAGEAARRVETAEALEFVSKVFWFSLEFGVLREPDGVKTYGAGLLSSYGEMQEFRAADLRPLEIARMGVQTYDITHYQPVLFCADSFAHVEDVIGAFFATVDDDAVRRYVQPAVQSA